MTVEIRVIDHRTGDLQPPGLIIKPWLWVPGLDPGTEYADYCALYDVWKRPGPPPEIVGFFGYRKYLICHNSPGIYDRAHAPNWWKCNEADFDEYRGFLVRYDGARFKELLAQYDILQAAPFPVDDLFNDFARSRSSADANKLYDAMPRRLGTSTMIYPYLFITRRSVFDRMMREMEPVRLELHGKCRGEDSTNEDYKKRPMAYVMERVYSLWLENSGLSIKEMPLLHCWEKH